MRVLLRNYLILGLWIALSFLFARESVLAQTVVTVASEAALRDAMAIGGLVRCSFDGTITLSNTIDVTLDVTLDALGHSVVISGNNSNRIFTVESGVTFSATNVVFANGQNVGQPALPGQGGAILSLGGSVWLTSCTLVSNSVTGGVAPSGGKGGVGQGGAIFVLGGSLMLQSVSLWNNAAVGGRAIVNDSTTATGGNGQGGAIYATDGTVLIMNCNLRSNICTASAGTTGLPGAKAAAAFGGAVFLGALFVSGSVTLSNSTLEANMALGSNAPVIIGPGNNATPGGAYGGALAAASGQMTLIRCQVISNAAIGGGAWRYSGTGEALGGAIYSSGIVSVSATECSFAGNQALSGSGSNINTDGRGGALYNLGSAIVNACSFVSNVARGGSAGAFGLAFVNYPGGHGMGAGIYNASQLNMTNCTIALNSAQGGEGGFPAGVPGSGLGGGVYNGNGVFTAVNVTIANNFVTPGEGYNFVGFSAGANIAVTNGTLALRNSLLAYPGGTNGNAWGTITDGGYNMSSDGSANFNSGSSFNFTDPLLQGLADNGGPTLTMALPPDTQVVWKPGQAKGLHHTSPAVDFGTAIGAPTTDQRGFPRPSGLRVDIGAYELQAPSIQPPLLTQSRLGDGQWLSFLGQWTGTYVLQKSTDLTNWTDTEVMGPLGSDAQVNLTNNVDGSAMEFFRLRVQ